MRHAEILRCDRCLIIGSERGAQKYRDEHPAFAIEPPLEIVYERLVDLRRNIYGPQAVARRDDRLDRTQIVFVQGVGSDDIERIHWARAESCRGGGGEVGFPELPQPVADER